MPIWISFGRERTRPRVQRVHRVRRVHWVPSLGRGAARVSSSRLASSPARRRGELVPTVAYVATVARTHARGAELAARAARAAAPARLSLAARPSCERRAASAELQVPSCELVQIQLAARSSQPARRRLTTATATTLMAAMMMMMMIVMVMMTMKTLARPAGRSKIVVRVARSRPAPCEVAPAHRGSICAQAQGPAQLATRANWLCVCLDAGSSSELGTCRRPTSGRRPAGATTISDQSNNSGPAAAAPTPGLERCGYSASPADHHQAPGWLAAGRTSRTSRTSRTGQRQAHTISHWSPAGPKAKAKAPASGPSRSAPVSARLWSLVAGLWSRWCLWLAARGPVARSRRKRAAESGAAESIWASRPAGHSAS